ncbi:MAG: hypothetical protein HFF58_00525 [Lawsonibacter sp.]|nr:hypothetical protein [Lawsonibacter sp.]
MKHKPPLILMEQMVMLLVFALAAALCLQAFVKSDGLSKDSEVRDRAVTLCQNAAETLRHFGGDMGNAQVKAAEKLGYQCYQGLLFQEFDEDWNPVEEGVYRLESGGVPTEVPGLWKAKVYVVTGYHVGQEPKVIFELEVAWQQEVSGGAD